jgi:hypothetical protein
MTNLWRYLDRDRSLSQDIYTQSLAPIIDTAFFEFTVKTDNAGTSNTDQFTFPLVSGGTYDFTVYASDGTVFHCNDYTANTMTFDGGAGTYTVRVVGTLSGWTFNDGGDKSKLTNISQLGIFNSGNQMGVFYGCSNLTITATDVMDMTGNTSMWAFFKGCSAITTIPSLSLWDWSNITILNSCFDGASNFNQDLSNINLTATHISGSLRFVLDDCLLFNSPLFDIPSGATDLTNFLKGAVSFDRDLSTLDMSAITDATNMLNGVTLSTANYDATLIGWVAQSLQSSVTLNFGTSTWSVGEAGQARYDMISTKSWTITDGGQADSTLCVWLNPHNLLKATANPADGTAVTSWKDLSDNDNNADEATNPPTFKTNIVGTEPMVLFDAVDDELTILADAAVDNLFATGGFFMCVLNPNSVATLARIFQQGNNTNNYLYIHDEDSGNARITFNKGFSTTEGTWQSSNREINIGQSNIIAVYYDGSDVANNPSPPLVRLIQPLRLQSGIRELGISQLMVILVILFSEKRHLRLKKSVMILTT